MDLSRLEALANTKPPSLKPHSPRRREVANHLARAAELAAEAELAKLSERSRFIAYYDCCHQACLAGLKLAGYRPAEGPGHRQIAFQAIEHALATSKDAIVAMSDANALRGKVEYDGALFEVTESLLAEIAGAAKELLQEARIALKGSKLV